MLMAVPEQHRDPHRRASLGIAAVQWRPVEDTLPPRNRRWIGRVIASLAAATGSWRQ
jgi:hypothetical protein